MTDQIKQYSLILLFVLLFAILTIGVEALKLIRLFSIVSLIIVFLYIIIDYKKWQRLSQGLRLLLVGAILLVGVTFFSSLSVRGHFDPSWSFHYATLRVEEIPSYIFPYTKAIIVAHVLILAGIQICSIIMVRHLIHKKRSKELKT
jgi:ABC-type multidrug transport system fused ATPase/permease subunit